MQYQTFRSVSDNHVFVVCRDGTFYEIVPEDVRKQGPWQGQHRGEMANLTTQYLHRHRGAGLRPREVRGRGVQAGGVNPWVKRG